MILKGFDNQMMIDATQMLYDAGIPTSINNIIGFPGETYCQLLERDFTNAFNVKNIDAVIPKKLLTIFGRIWIIIRTMHLFFKRLGPLN